jgi:hypothetical protein
MYWCMKRFPYLYDVRRWSIVEDAEAFEIRVFESRVKCPGSSSFDLHRQICGRLHTDSIRSCCLIITMWIDGVEECRAFRLRPTTQDSDPRHTVPASGGVPINTNPQPHRGVASSTIPIN